MHSTVHCIMSCTFFFRTQQHFMSAWCFPCWHVYKVALHHVLHPSSARSASGAVPSSGTRGWKMQLSECCNSSSHQCPGAPNTVPAPPELQPRQSSWNNAPRLARYQASGGTSILAMSLVGVACRGTNCRTAKAGQAKVGVMTKLGCDKTGNAGY